eukprot:Opistho-2@46124
MGFFSKQSDDKSDDKMSEGAATSGTDSDNDVFEDALEGSSGAVDENNLPDEHLDHVTLDEQLAQSSARQRRTALPSEDTRGNFSFWTVMKNSIGKDLSKIAMPIQFNEPISFLQRLCEDYEYTSALDEAANVDKNASSALRTAFVAAFALTSYSTTDGRVGKPFNPLLGETYECVREDMGWRYIAEQVSHHPPITSAHCESRSWACWQEYRLCSKFRGQYLKVMPEGCQFVRIKATGELLSWRKPTTTIHNIILGKLWIDHEGDIVVTNHTTGDIATIHCHPWSKVGKTYREITGHVHDAEGNEVLELTGGWETSVEAKPVGDSDVAAPVTLWTCNPRIPEAAKQYGFTKFAAQLNEMEAGVCPTDSRLRPDQRLMEEGKIDEGAKEKTRLEEKQRSVRKAREAVGRPYTPRWFTKKGKPDNDDVIHVYKGGYWDAKKKGVFEDVADIY